MRAKHVALPASILLILSAPLCDARPVITRVVPSPDGLSLDWTSTTDRYIVAESSDLTADRFQYVGMVVSTNHADVTNPADAAFFRVRHVTVVDFPDPNLNARVEAAITTKHFPTNLIYDVDLEGITRLDASSSMVSNTAGLDAMTDMRTLHLDCNPITHLDLPPLASLQDLSLAGLLLLTNVNLRNCPNLTNLSVTGCTGLTSLSCSGSSLTGLDISSCTNLHILDAGNNAFTSLTWLYLPLPLTSVDVSECTNLATLWCVGSFPLLTNINVAGCSSLYDVIIRDALLLTALDFRGDTSLWWVKCHDNASLATLDVTGCTNIETLDCHNDPLLTSVDVSGSAGMHLLDCSNDGLTNLNVSGCLALRRLECRGNRLTTLDVSDSTNMSMLVCMGNQLTNVDISGLTALNSLYCSENRLTDLDIAGLTDLWEVNCSSNQITDLSSFVSNATAGGLRSCSVDVRANPLSDFAKTNQIPILRGYGVSVYYDP